MPENRSNDPKSPPLERYFSILEVLCAVPNGLGLGDIAELLDLPRQTAHRLLANLHASHLVQIKGGRGQSYVVADRVRKLAALAASDDMIQSLTTSVLKRLSDEVNETTFLARLEGTIIRSVAMVSPDAPWRGFVLPGKILQPHATASGKAIMAFQPKAVMEKALAGRLQKLTSKTITSKAALEAHYVGVRECGYATCIGEVDESLAAIAVPVHMEKVGVVFSVGMVGPLTRITGLIKNGIHLRMQSQAKSIAVAMSLGRVDMQPDLKAGVAGRWF